MPQVLALLPLGMMRWNVYHKSRLDTLIKFNGEYIMFLSTSTPLSFNFESEFYSL